MSTSAIAESQLSNKDLAPTGPEQRTWGTYHLAGPEPTTWLDVLVRCREMADLPGSVEPQRAIDVGLEARRPSFSALTSVMVPGTPVPPFPPLDDALARFLERV